MAQDHGAHCWCLAPKTITLHRALSYVTPHLITPSTGTHSLSSTPSSSHVLHPPLSEHKPCGDLRPHLSGGLTELRPFTAYKPKQLCENQDHRHFTEDTHVTEHEDRGFASRLLSSRNSKPLLNTPRESTFYAFCTFQFVSLVPRGLFEQQMQHRDRRSSCRWSNFSDSSASLLFFSTSSVRNKLQRTKRERCSTKTRTILSQNAVPSPMFDTDGNLRWSNSEQKKAPAAKEENRTMSFLPSGYGKGTPPPDTSRFHVLRESNANCGKRPHAEF